MNIKTFLISLPLFLSNFSVSKDKEFVVLIASFNNKNWYKLNLDSLISQTYNKYTAIYMDDMSTDGTAELVKQYVKEKNCEDKIKLIINKEKLYCLGNYYKTIQSIPNNKIIVTLDGDDWFAHKNVLKFLNSIYQNPNIWLTYGSNTEYPLKQTLSFVNKPFPIEIMKNNQFREYHWVTGHLRSFYAGLFKRIKYDDLLDQNGQLFKAVEDVAYMLPMLEMSGLHTRFISNILYVYNKANALNTSNVIGGTMIELLKNLIYNREKYLPLTKPPYLN